MYVSDHEDGQFDDAPEFEGQRHAPTAPANPREGRGFIDDPLLEWSESDEEDESSDAFLNEEDFEDNRVEDEDWEITERGSRFSFFCGSA